MKWQPYPQYKPSGVEWLGEIPVDWEIWKVSHGFKSIGSGTTPKSDDLSFYEGDIPWVTTSELRESTIYDTNSKLTNLALNSFSSLKLYPTGTVLIAMYGATIGRLGILGIPATVNQACCAFSDSIIFDIQFFFYWLLYRKPVLISRSVGGGQPNLNQEDLKALRIPTPSLDEQRAIASFLDRETARIDALMEKKQRQIELLQEKRAALISHAVTKGLKKEVKMKPSGIDWLGEIPEGWQVKRIKRIGKIKYGLGEPPRQFEDGLPFIRATDIYRGKINSEGILKVDSQDIPWSRDPELRTNDILVVRSGAYTGDSAIVSKEWEGAIAGYDMVLRVTGAMPQFVACSLLSKYLLYGQIYLERSRAAQPHLNAEELGSFIILLPPKSEQEEIVSYLDFKTQQTDALIEKINDSIILLREYRTAFISAAVTGKIDVREAAA